LDDACLFNVFHVFALLNVVCHCRKQQLLTEADDKDAVLSDLKSRQRRLLEKTGCAVMDAEIRNLSDELHHLRTLTEEQYDKIRGILLPPGVKSRPLLRGDSSGTAGDDLVSGYKSQTSLSLAKDGKQLRGDDDEAQIPNKFGGDSQSPRNKLISDSRLPSDKMVGDSQLPGDKLVGDSQLPSDKMVGDSQLPSDKLVGDSQLPSDKLVGDSRLPSDKMVGDSQLPSDKMGYRGQTIKELEGRVADRTEQLLPAERDGRKNLVNDNSQLSGHTQGDNVKGKDFDGNTVQKVSVGHKDGNRSLEDEHLGPKKINGDSTLPAETDDSSVDNRDSSKHRSETIFNLEGKVAKKSGVQRSLEQDASKDALNVQKQTGGLGDEFSRGSVGSTEGHNRGDGGEKLTATASLPLNSGNELKNGSARKNQGQVQGSDGHRDSDDEDGVVQLPGRKQQLTGAKEDVKPHGSLNDNKRPSDDTGPLNTGDKSLDTIDGRKPNFGSLDTDTRRPDSISGTLDDNKHPDTISGSFGGDTRQPNTISGPLNYNRQTDNKPGSLGDTRPNAISGGDTRRPDTVSGSLDDTRRSDDISGLLGDSRHSENISGSLGNTRRPNTIFGGDTRRPDTIVGGDTRHSENIPSSLGDSRRPDTIIGDDTKRPDTTVGGDTRRPDTIVGGDTRRPDTIVGGDTRRPDTIVGGDTRRPDTISSTFGFDIKRPDTVSGSLDSKKEKRSGEGLLAVDHKLHDPLSHNNNNNNNEGPSVKGGAVRRPTWHDVIRQQSVDTGDNGPLFVDIDEQQTTDVGYFSLPQKLTATNVLPTSWTATAAPSVEYQVITNFTCN
jgi:hypothetical protein